MTDIRTETIQVEADNGRITMTYVLNQVPSGPLGMRYGISLCNRNTGELVTIQDITTDPEAARALFGRLVRGSVTTVSFREIVEDFLAAG